MGTMQHRGYTAAVEWVEEAKQYWGEALGTWGKVVFYDDTWEKAYQAFKDTLDWYLGECEKDGEEPRLSRRRPMERCRGGYASRGSRKPFAMEHRGYTAIVEWSNEDGDGSFNGDVVGTRDGFFFFGYTLPYLRKALQELVDCYLESCEEHGEEPCRPMPKLVQLALQAGSADAGQPFTRMDYKGYTAIVKWSDESGVFRWKVVGAGDKTVFPAQTVPEARAAFEAAVDAYLEDCLARGAEPCRPTHKAARSDDFWCWT